ncbi:hypothetical protein UO65_2801 [Actinokineospora spheciospongiae]|uniref:Uncharacterized protein n=1 Tax=Actinokineospora spheciospongiae TaxID=909613 RepID=W7IN93_9PSEU|nr:hypothetical protein UO65_2801 [Actinokineospora spheciospongiae]
MFPHNGFGGVTTVRHDRGDVIDAQATAHRSGSSRSRVLAPSLPCSIQSHTPTSPSENPGIARRRTPPGPPLNRPGATPRRASPIGTTAPLRFLTPCHPNRSAATSRQPVRRTRAPPPLLSLLSRSPRSRAGWSGGVACSIQVRR